MTVNDEQWSLIHYKYSGLMWTISHKISGDAAISSPEDNYADLQIAALDAVAGFEKKTGRAFDEFWGDKLFDQYFKTCLWNMKNNKGKRIAKKYPLTKNTVNLGDYEEVLDIASKEHLSLENNLFLEEIVYILSGDQRRLLNLLVQDPTAIKLNGRINRSKVARELGIPWRHIDIILNSMSKIIGNEL